MKSTKLTFVTAAVFIITGSCYYPRVTVDRSQTWRTSRNVSKLLVIRTDVPEIDYTGSIKEEFGTGNTTYLISSYLDSILPSRIDLYSIFDSVNLINYTAGLNLVKTILPYKRNDSISLLLPSPGHTLQFDTDIILFIGAITVQSYVKVNIMTNGPIPVGAFPSKPLVMSAPFCYYDNAEGKPVAYGIADHVDGDLCITKKVWNRASDGFAKWIVKGTPFYNDSLDQHLNSRTLNHRKLK